MCSLPNGLLKSFRNPQAGLKSLVLVLCFAIATTPVTVRAGEFDPTCVVALLKQTNTGPKYVNIPNEKHAIVRQFMEPDGRIKQSNIRPLKQALGLDKIQVAGYFDCPNGACGTKKISAHPRDADAEEQLSCPNCGSHVTKGTDPFYEGFDENGTIPLDRLILEPDVVEKYSNKPLQRCDNCGTFNYQNSGNCGGCGAPPPKNPIYIQPAKKKVVSYSKPIPTRRTQSVDLEEAMISVLFIVGVVAGVVVVIYVLSQLPPEAFQNSGGYHSSDDSDSSYTPSFSFDTSSSSSSSSYSDYGSSSSSSSSSSYGDSGGGSSNANGTFDY